MPHCNTKTPVHIISLKWNFEKLLLVTCGSTKACFAVLHIKGWISSVLRCLLWLAFSFVQSNDAWQAAWFPLAGSEVAWYNSYSLAKVLHSSDFHCVMHNMDKITKWIAAFSMDINDTLITWVTCVSNHHPSLLSIYVQDHLTKLRPITSPCAHGRGQGMKHTNSSWSFWTLQYNHHRSRITLFLCFSQSNNGVNISVVYCLLVHTSLAYCILIFAYCILTLACCTLTLACCMHVQIYWQ